MKVKLKSSLIDLRPGVQLFVESGWLVIEDGAKASAAIVHAEPAELPAPAQPEKPAKPVRRKLNKGFSRRKRERDPSYGPLENDILVTLSKAAPVEQFHPLGEVFAMTRPDAPSREGNRPSFEYNRVRTALDHLIEDGYIEANRITTGRMGYRVSPTLNNTDPSKPAH